MNTIDPPVVYIKNQRIDMHNTTVTDVLNGTPMGNKDKDSLKLFMGETRYYYEVHSFNTEDFTIWNSFISH